MNESRGCEGARSVPITHLGMMLIRQVVCVNSSSEPFCVSYNPDPKLLPVKEECTGMSQYFPTLFIRSVNEAGFESSWSQVTMGIY